VNIRAVFTPSSTQGPLHTMFLAFSQSYTTEMWFLPTAQLRIACS